MCCGAERLSAERAVELGIVSALEADYDALVRRAAARVRELATDGLPPAGTRVAAEADLVFEPGDGGAAGASAEVVQIILGAIREGVRASSMDQALEASYLAFGRAMCTEAAREGVGASRAARR
jgi:enoyl-CoA hydratase/carnithine racemase